MVLIYFNRFCGGLLMMVVVVVFVVVVFFFLVNCGCHGGGSGESGYTSFSFRSHGSGIFGFGLC